MEKELKLKEILAERGISMPYLIMKIGISPADILGLNVFTKRYFLLKIAETLNVTVGELYKTPDELNSKSIFIEKNGFYTKIGELPEISNH